jgi:CDP-diacylglycerol--serine O-phosphatidyltransferase
MSGPVRRTARGLPLRALAPNAITALALCFGLTGVRFAIAEDWERAIAAIMVAALLDGMDGRIARLVRGESRFGAELDSLSDVIAFGVSPAIVIYLWSLQHYPQLGWVFALSHAVCCALRLARFNAAIDATEQPHKSAGFFTGIPSPAGAGLALLPLYLWLWTGLDIFREAIVVAPWVALVAFLMISNLATFSTAIRLRRSVRLPALVLVALIAGALISAPWPTLSILALAYAGSIPFSVRRYARIKRLRARPAAAPEPSVPDA